MTTNNIEIGSKVRIGADDNVVAARYRGAIGTLVSKQIHFGDSVPRADTAVVRLENDKQLGVTLSKLALVDSDADSDEEKPAAKEIPRAIKPTKSPAELKTFKIALVGDGGVGKTTWVKGLLTGEFQRNYVPTLGVEVHPIRINTQQGVIQFNIWDCAGQDQFGGLRDGYYISADAAIVMCDTTNRRSFHHVASWIKELQRVHPDIPIVIAGHKCDQQRGEFGITVQEERQMVDAKLKGVLEYINTSAKSNFNSDAPLLAIARCLLKDPALAPVDEIAVPPPTASPLPTGVDARPYPGGEGRRRVDEFLTEESAEEEEEDTPPSRSMTCFMAACEDDSCERFPRFFNTISKAIAYAKRCGKTENVYTTVSRVVMADTDSENGVAPVIVCNDQDY